MSAVHSFGTDPPTHRYGFFQRHRHLSPTTTRYLYLLRRLLPLDGSIAPQLRMSGIEHKWVKPLCLAPLCNKSCRSRRRPLTFTASQNPSKRGKLLIFTTTATWVIKLPQHCSLHGFRLSTSWTLDIVSTTCPAAFIRIGFRPPQIPRFLTNFKIWQLPVSLATYASCPSTPLLYDGLPYRMGDPGG